MHDDQKIIEQLNHGSHEAFRMIFDAHKYRLMAVILRLVNSPQVGEEIFQRVFVRLWENRVVIRINVSLAAYLNAIARNEVYAYWRAALNKKSILLGLSDDLPDIGLIDEEIENTDLRNYLFSLAESLPARCRQIFEMRFKKQMSHREIAHDLDISESTVENQITKAPNISVPNSSAGFRSNIHRRPRGEDNPQRKVVPRLRAHRLGVDAEVP